MSYVKVNNAKAKIGKLTRVLDVHIKKIALAKIIIHQLDFHNLILTIKFRFKVQKLF